jgi:hypothetical protein
MFFIRWRLCLIVFQSKKTSASHTIGWMICCVGQERLSGASYAARWRVESTYIGNLAVAPVMPHALLFGPFTAMTKGREAPLRWPSSWMTLAHVSSVSNSISPYPSVTGFQVLNVKETTCLAVNCHMLLLGIQTSSLFWKHWDIAGRIKPNNLLRLLA